LDNPSGVTLDADGNLYIADTNNSRVREVSAAGIITTMAGTGYSSYSGDGGPATAAWLSNPFGVMVGASGNLYIADSYNGRVREVSPAGIITTVAGNGSCCYSGDRGLATSASLWFPSGVAVDASGNLYIADTDNSRVRLVVPQGGEAVISLTLTHSGNFKAGQSGAYTVMVSNAPSAGATSGAVTVTETIPSGLTLVSMTGSGWGCSGNTCTRSDPLSGGSSYAAITVTVNVASSVTSQVTNQASVSGGGIAASAIDTTLMSYLLTTTALGGGSITANPTSADGYYAAGTTVCLAAIPYPGWQFVSWSGASLNGSNCLTMTADESVTANLIVVLGGTGLYFYPVAPCRLADTRGNGFTGAFGPPSMSGGSTRAFPISSSGCNISSTAQAYSLNVTAVPPGQLTYLTTWPTALSQPTVSTLNDFSTGTSLAGNVQANAAIVPAGIDGSASIYVSDTSDVIIDINGYFAPPGTGGLVFYPATPCRVADTRGYGFPAGAFGPPTMTAGSTRSFPISQGPCGIPSTAQAYSLNMTAVPVAELTYLTAWATGQAQPPTSTLNDFSIESSTLDLGRAVANAAIVPAGTGGAVSVFVTDSTDVIIDINGYFAPPGTGGLSFYTATPCRVADTRGNGFPAGAFGPPSMAANATRTFPLPTSSCNVPSTAQAYSLNMTVVPPGQLTYLTTWAAGQAQPGVSTLNDFSTSTGSPLLGWVVANAAIVPAGTSGSINVYVSNPTDVIIDINGYFAP
jgi:uncharacterized repeat protein (TIGR01451 family)